jgi:hypothetical protein
MIVGDTELGKATATAAVIFCSGLSQKTPANGFERISCIFVAKLCFPTICGLFIELCTEITTFRILSSLLLQFN